MTRTPTFMSLQRLLTVCDLRNPNTFGVVGSVTSTNEVPSSQPTNAYSLYEDIINFPLSLVWFCNVFFSLTNHELGI